jgi:hypothetical protein
MVAIGTGDVSAARGTERDRQRAPDKRSVSRFKSMLDQTVAMTNPMPMPFEQRQPIASREDEDAGRASVKTRAPIADTPAPTTVLLPANSAQTLALRASTGPLAGLVVQAGWRDDRLHLRVKAPTDELRRRIAQHHGQLAKSLGDALGVTVVLEIDPDHV